MPRKKNWKIGKARKDALRCHEVDESGVLKISDGGLAHPLPVHASVSDGRPSVVIEGVRDISDGGLAHPQKPSVFIEGVTEISDGGLAHPQKPSVSLNIFETCLNTSRTLKWNYDRSLILNSEVNPAFKPSSLQFGSFHQGHQMFSVDSRGNQCTANALCSLIYAEFAQLESKENLDSVLIDGDILYEEIISDLKEQDAFKSVLLNFDEIPNNVKLLNKNITFEKCDVISGVCTQQAATDGLPSLLQGLQDAFQNTSHLLLMIGSVCSAVFRKGDMFYLFDSHSHGPDGMSCADGHSILISFNCLDDLVMFMYALYHSMLIDLTEQFDMLPIKFTVELGLYTDVRDSNSSDVQSLGPSCKSETSSLLQRYFIDQSCKQKKKKDSHQENTLSLIESTTDRKQQKRNEYIRNYKRTRRLIHEQILKDRSMTLKRMRELRKAPERKQKERLMTNSSMEKTRQAPGRKEKERLMTNISMEKTRQAPGRKEKERLMTNISMEKTRQAPGRKEKERLMTNISMEKTRQAPGRTEKERLMTNISMQKTRQAPGRKEKERLMTNISMQKTRQAPGRKEKERLMTNISMQKTRQAPGRKEKERLMTNSSKQKTRQAPGRKEKERLMTNSSKQKTRQAPGRKEKERLMTNSSKQKTRQAPGRKEKERLQTLASMHKCRSSTLFRDGERLIKQSKRKCVVEREVENARNKEIKRHKRATTNVMMKEKEYRKIQRYGKNIESCIEKFKTSICEGPIFVCTCCHQTWFRHSMTLTDKVKHRLSADIIKKCFTQYLSVNDCEWICSTCLENLKRNKVPSMSVINKNSFPVRPKELELHQLEERLVSLRIPFMQIRELPRGGQLSIKGNVVNVPIDIQPVIHSLPRTFDSHCTIPVKLKKKLSYQKFDFSENIRPVHVISALHWLLKHSDMYKESGISIDDDWFNTITADCSEMVKGFLGVDAGNKDKATSENQESSDINYDSDHFSEIDETDKVIGNSDTMLDVADPSNDTVYTFAPGEGQTPLSLYHDKDAEYLSFPTIFCGQQRVPNDERDVSIHYSDVCKLELRHIDRRVASNIANIFFKLKKVQLKQVSDKVYLALRRCKTDGKKFTASEMLDINCLHSIVKLDEGYYIFRSLRNSPPYFESRKKDVFAMIRQLGLPTWFISLSAADTRWYDLLKILSQINNTQTLTNEDIDAMSWVEKTKLVQKDPVTCVRYFDHRVQKFINTVLKSHHEPLGKVVDYFYRVEFQQRGSPHIHMLVWIENAPHYKTHTVDEVTSFIDRYVSCEKDCDKRLVELQVHKHSKSCRKKEKAVCRFGFPIPPMKMTTVLEPLSDLPDKKQFKDLFLRIQKQLDDVKDVDMTYHEFLSLLSVNEDEYIKAVQSSLNCPKVFLKRNVKEARVNAYMKPILNAWGANHDLQYVLDPYACAVYIVSYISKAQRGMSILMNEACKEARNGNMELRQQVRHIGNKFLNSVEVSAQEACYLLLQLPLTKSTRDVVFINTSPPEQRTFLLKSKEALEKLPSNSTNIGADNIINRYSKRPKILENWCLADYVSQLDINYRDFNHGSSTPENSESDQLLPENSHEKNDEAFDTWTNDDEQPINEKDNDFQEFTRKILPGGQIVLKNGITISERKHKKVIRYVRFSKKTDLENFYRERLLLFMPWRNESTDLKQGHNSYQASYMLLRRIIENKASKYENNTDELDDALERAQNETNFDDVAPGNEQAEQDDAEIGPSCSQEFIYFDPDRPDNQRHYDIAGDVGLSVASVDIGIRRKTMPDSKYRELINSLNIKQREFFEHVLQTVKRNKDRLHVFLSGGAGVGKSVLVTAIYEALQRFLTSKPGDNPEDCKILLCAPTGKAAFHINGITIHSAFRIPASQGYECISLNSDTLNTLRTKYKDLAVVMIDEVSMVGHNMLKLINERLKQIKGSTLPFGGLHMICIGDLFQLKPVMDGWIFENLKRNFGPLATNLWQDLICMHELDEIMRQKNDKQFAEVLNRLREGKQTKQDVGILKGRLTNTCTQESSYPEKAVHLFNTNESVNNFNSKTYLNVTTEKTTVSALDHVLGDDVPAVKQRLLSKLPNDSTHTAGLSKNLGIAVGMIYDLCLNLDVDDGLVNGSTCVVSKIEHRQKNTNRPSVIWVSFNNTEIGSAWRSKYRHLYHNAIDSNWTPIFDCKRNFLYLRKTFVRIQIPLRQATAKTVHKSQGDTLDQVVIDLSGNRVFPHAHYVAISRSRTLEGLFILNLNENKISVSDKVQKEMARLRETRQLKLCYTPVYAINGSHFICMFHNVQSLRCHKNELFSDPNFQASDIVGLVETWLTRTDDTESLYQDGYQLYRSDGLQKGNSRPHRGIVMYVKNDVHVIHNYSVVTDNIEMMVLEVQCSEQLVVIASLYRSPAAQITNLKTFLTDNLHKFSQGKHLIIQGDTNINILERGSSIGSFMQNAFFCQQAVQKPTHYSGSLIDHVYTNIQTAFTDVIECVWSDHSLIYTAFPKSVDHSNACHH